MTPKQYLELERVQQLVIAHAESLINEARKQADKCPPPKKRRPAVARDIVEGAIIWHERKKADGGDYWNIVAEPMHYGDAFKAYCADDGCRYGLQGAYVEVDQ